MSHTLPLVRTWYTDTDVFARRPYPVRTRTWVRASSTIEWIGGVYPPCCYPHACGVCAARVQTARVHRIPASVCFFSPHDAMHYPVGHENGISYSPNFVNVCIPFVAFCLLLPPQPKKILSAWVSGARTHSCHQNASCTTPSAEKRKEFECPHKV